MARKLKTFTTSAGFFDLAVAAPSMKAAIAAWGAEENLFRNGFAKASNDPDVVAATMEKPGVVLRRPVGSDDPYSEDAALPEGPASRKPGRSAKRSTPKQTARASSDSHKHEQRREKEALKRERARRDRAVAAAQAALDKALRRHCERLAEMEKAQEALDRRAKMEKTRWQKQRGDLEAALKRARK